jgi:hypothetical protein
MPQPAVHLIIANRALARWHSAGATPFEAGADGAANAFRMGAVAPDMGLFPGGMPSFSSHAHLHRTGELTRRLIHQANTPLQQAFAWGWLTHVLADAAIHPIVNAHALAQGNGSLADHVRVEVGIDIALACDDGALHQQRLHCPFRRADLRFIGEAFKDVYGWRPNTCALMQMQRGMLHFTRLCVHFATVAPTLCWHEAATTPPPLASSLTWRLVSALSAEHSTAFAYMNPLRPAAGLLGEVSEAFSQIDTALEALLQHGLDFLPDYDLQTGDLLSARRAA